MRQVLDFNQGRDLAAYMKLASVSSGGVCAACSIYYLLEVSEGREFGPWINSIANKAKVVNVHAGAKDPDIYMAKIYNIMNTKFRRRGTLQGWVHQLFLAITVPPELATLRWVAFTSPRRLFFPSVGHAVAVARTEDSLRFFDPNYGEWEFEDLKEWYPWIGGFFRQHYHDRFYDGTIEVQYLDPR